MKNNFKGNLILLLTSVIWGLAFVAQSNVAHVVEPFTLNGVRCLIAAVLLVPTTIFFSSKNKNFKNIHLIVSGTICGILLCIAINLQQFGIEMYPENAAVSGRSGFITALYVILVPVIGLAFGKKTNLFTWIGVGMATAGMYFLSFSQGIDKLYFADLIVLLCAIAFSLQILVIDKFADRVDGIKLAIVEFFVCGIISITLAFVFETPKFSSLLSVWESIMYLAVLSNGVAYTLQIIGQKYSGNPTVASVIMSFEAVFAALGGVLLIGETLTTKEIIGCTIMFISVIIVNLPVDIFKKNRYE